MTAALLLGLASFLVLPWYALEDGFFGLAWLGWYPFDPDTAPALLQGLLYDRAWLLPVSLPLLAPLLWKRPWVLLASGIAGLVYVLAQGFCIGPLGPCTSLVDPSARQFGIGAGGLCALSAFVLYAGEGLARRGFARGDAFVCKALLAVSATTALFVLYPVGTIVVRAVVGDDDRFSLALLAHNLASARLAGSAARSLLLATLTGAGTTVLGACFALVAARTRLRGSRVLRALTVLPVITPPFVIGLALILAFGRAGALTVFLEHAFGLPASRYIFGFPGLFLAQMLAFTPVAFMILTGVVEGVSPSLEEAAQMLGASRGRTLLTVTLPLMRPGLANAFLVGFVESLADFGNPIVLAGSSFDVLATDIYFAVAGAQADLPRAAAFALVLLVFVLGAFALQQRWVGGGRRYTTVTGKGDAGLPCPLPRALELGLYGVVLPWATFTFAIYALVLLGGFVENLGIDHRLTLGHYRDLFAISGLHFTGGAWSSLATTVSLAAIAAVLTAVVGLLTAWLLARQRFPGRTAFELATMVSFAVPGTVVGVGYVLAFNAPPFELTGTAAVLVIAFVFRNMPVGVRAGMATLSQIDASLDEASMMLGAGTTRTLRRVVLPLMKPAVVTSLVYGFVRAMTAVSAVIFLVSAEHNLATTYILGRVEGGEYGRAIAYCSVLILLMAAVMALIQRVVGERALSRRVVA